MRHKGGRNNKNSDQDSLLQMLHNLTGIINRQRTSKDWKIIFSFYFHRHWCSPFQEHSKPEVKSVYLYVSHLPSICVTFKVLIMRRKLKETRHTPIAKFIAQKKKKSTGICWLKGVFSSAGFIIVLKSLIPLLNDVLLLSKKPQK